jgi:hypothetical protein
MSTVYEPGHRVAVISADRKSFLGYGEYLGDFDCEPMRLWMAEKAREMGEHKLANDFESGKLSRTNPKIRLDSGQELWGCECWWGDAEQFDRTRKQPTGGGGA